MKTIKYIFLGYLLSIHANIYAGDAGILGGVSQPQIRDGDIHTDDIPKILKYAVDFLMGFTGTIAIIFVIVGAYKIALGTLEGDKSKGKETIIYALGGFILAACSWLIMKFVIDNFS